MAAHAYIPFAFQFHYGSIRTPRHAQNARNHIRFNSIMVQLGHAHLSSPLCECVFQFHYGSIRTRFKTNPAQKIVLNNVLIFIFIKLLKSLKIFSPLSASFSHYKHSEFIFLLPKFIYSKVEICNIYYLKSFSQGAL